MSFRTTLFKALQVADEIRVGSRERQLVVSVEEGSEPTRLILWLMDGQAVFAEDIEIEVDENGFANVHLEGEAELMEFQIVQRRGINAMDIKEMEQGPST